MHGTQPVTLITQNEKMREILRKIDKISDSDTSVLLVGETGVGRLTGLTDNYLRIEAEGPADLWNQFSWVNLDKLIPGGVQGTILDI